VANLDAFILGVDDPANLSSAGEEILQPVVDLGAAIAWREYLDGQVRSAGKEFAR